MPARKTIVIGAVAAVAIGVGGAAGLAALDDPDEPVASVSLSEARAEGTASPTAQDGSSRQVPGLDELQGIVTDNDDDGTDDRGNDDADDGPDDSGDDADDSSDDGADEVADDLEINGVDLDFGPDEWLATADAVEDFDGDGTTSTLRDELAGLVGQEVTLLVRFDDDGDDADVYAIGDLTYRDVSAPAPWLPADSATDEALQATAAEAVGEGAEVIELDPEDDGDVAWEAKVRAADGTEHEVRLDAAGAVIDVRDDD
jgi:uncharacterized membrane protein YkoI